MVPHVRSTGNLSSKYNVTIFDVVMKLGVSFTCMSCVSSAKGDRGTEDKADTEQCEGTTRSWTQSRSGNDDFNRIFIVIQLS